MTNQTTGQENSKKLSYQVYYNDRKNNYIVVEEQEMDGEKELDLLLHGYSNLVEDISSYEKAEEFISNYIYQKLNDFRIQKGYKRLSSKRVRSYE